MKIQKAQELRRGLRNATGERAVSARDARELAAALRVVLAGRRPSSITRAEAMLKVSAATKQRTAR